MAVLTNIGGYSVYDYTAEIDFFVCDGCSDGGCFVLRVYGTDDFGFSALPGGCRHAVGDFYDAGDYGYWWTAKENDENKAYYQDMAYDHDGVFENYDRKVDGRSVRCVKDK